MTALSININKVALLRNSRPGNYPDVAQHAEQCLANGAHGITVHPRPDQRHIRPSDVRDIHALVARHPQAEFNIEGNPFAAATGDYPGFMALVRESIPHQCTLVPDNTQQLTSDHGFDLRHDATALAPVIRELRDRGCRVCLFMDPDPDQIKRAADAGADRIELYTGPYAAAFTRDDHWQAVLEHYRIAAETARSCGLGVNAGHDLNLHNLPTFLSIPHILEVSIGHAFIADALQIGMQNALTAYLAICHSTPAQQH